MDSTLAGFPLCRGLSLGNDEKNPHTYAIRECDDGIGSKPFPLTFSEVKPFHFLGVLWVVLRDLSGSVVEVEI